MDWTYITLPSNSAKTVLTNQPVDYKEDAYDVPQDQACEILAKKAPDAAAWWNANGYPQLGSLFVFRKDEAVILKERGKESEEGGNPIAWG